MKGCNIASEIALLNSEYERGGSEKRARVLGFTGQET
jgi:hypothetical protein